MVLVRENNMFSKINLSIMGISVFLLSNCGLYSLSAFGSSNQWEIYTEEGRSASIFKMDVCGGELGYGHSYLDRKALKDIQEIVYPKLKKLIENQASLCGCSVKRESITFAYGASQDWIGADIICKRRIMFKENKGRLFMTSFSF